ncbi:AAA family ATPase [Streptomyces sp. NPDC018347]|uniref:ATP-binding protein n=1 Tax=Streptomyces sp. NPDC018347 TaxID=3157193 RepID=UPI0034004135
MVHRPVATTAAPLVGHDEEVAHIDRLLGDAEAGKGSAWVLVGEPGAGKSVLLDTAARRAARQGVTVLRAAGYENERKLVFAGLRRLLEPLLAGARHLPGEQGEALLVALGLRGAPFREPDDHSHRLLIYLGMRALLSRASRERPLLLIVDDVQWLDLCTLDALTFAARRVAGDGIVILTAARTDQVPGRLGSGFRRLVVPALGARAAARLLDLQPDAPRGPLRAAVLRQAAGNPLALIELARATADSSAGAEYALNGTLPLPQRLERMFADRLSGLPRLTRRALLFAAAADGSDLPAALLAASAGDPAGGLDAWFAAENEGLVRLDSGHVEFRHPMMRSAVYQTATFAERRDVHLALAEALTDDPDRRAWHLAAATLAPDEEIAGLLWSTADRARRRGGYPAAAAALERAAQLTPDPGRRGQRLLEACDLAMHAGRPHWVERLAAQVTTGTSDPHLATGATLLSCWAMAATGRHRAALDRLLPLAESAVGTAGDVALAALSQAVDAIHYTGDETHRRTALELLPALTEGAGDDCRRLWVRVGCDPLADRDAHLRQLRRVMARRGHGPHAPALLGATAWLLDETRTAVGLLGTAMEQMRRVDPGKAHAEVGQTLAAAQFESGAWESAWALNEEVYETAVENGLDPARRSAMCVKATMLALRGEAGCARDLADRAAAGVDPAESRALYAAVLAVRGAAACAEGDHELAFEHLRGLFTPGPDLRPLHYRLPLYHVGDLAAEAVYAGRQAEAAAVLRSVAARPAGGDMSRRLAMQVHRARALLASDAESGAHFTAALADPEGEQWPFERARIALEYGQWLRRRRTVAQARTLFAQALTTFQQLRARPWAEQAAEGLRACGAVVPPEVGGRGRLLDRLTPQQSQVVRLAAAGLTNRQIADRLLLSPRTVGFHLYQAFPKLGVTTRAQLRDALDAGSGDRGVPGRPVPDG